MQKKEEVKKVKNKKTKKTPNKKGVTSSIKKKKKTGRKNAYQEKIKPNLELIAAMKIKGYEDKDIMQEIGVTKTPFYKYLKEEKEFRDAYKKSTLSVGALVEHKLLQKALEGDTTSLIYLDKKYNRTIDKYHEERINIEKEKLNKGNDKENLTINIINGEQEKQDEE